MRSDILPESCYELENKSIDDLKASYKLGRPIVGFVEEINEPSGYLKVKLSDTIIGILPFNEVTIYDFHYSPNTNRRLPIQVCILLHKIIRVKVTGMSGNLFFLSRKKNMLDSLKEMEDFSMFLMDITKTYSDKVYGDCGDGIVGFIPKNEISRTKLKHSAEVLHVKQKVWANKVNISDNQLCLSYKSTFAKYDPSDYIVGDSIVCTLKNPLDDMQTAYFAYINPQISGTGANGLKLRFSRFHKDSHQQQ